MFVHDSCDSSYHHKCPLCQRKSRNANFWAQLCFICQSPAGVQPAGCCQSNTNTPQQLLQGEGIFINVFCFPLYSRNTRGVNRRFRHDILDFDSIPAIDVGLYHLPIQHSYIFINSQRKQLKYIQNKRVLTMTAIWIDVFILHRCQWIDESIYRSRSKYCHTPPSLLFIKCGNLSSLQYQHTYHHWEEVLWKYSDIVL